MGVADRGGRAVSGVGQLLGPRVRNTMRAWMLLSCVSCVLCMYRPLGRADHSFRGVLADVCLINVYKRVPTCTTQLLF